MDCVAANNPPFLNALVTAGSNEIMWVVFQIKPWHFPAPANNTNILGVKKHKVLRATYDGWWPWISAFFLQELFLSGCWMLVCVCVCVWNWPKEINVASISSQCANQHVPVVPPLECWFPCVGDLTWFFLKAEINCENLQPFEKSVWYDWAILEEFNPYSIINLGFLTQKLNFERLEPTSGILKFSRHTWISRQLLWGAGTSVLSRLQTSEFKSWS